MAINTAIIDTRLKISPFLVFFRGPLAEYLIYVQESWMEGCTLAIPIKPLFIMEGELWDFVDNKWVSQGDDAWLDTSQYIDFPGLGDNDASPF